MTNLELMIKNNLIKPVTVHTAKFITDRVSLLYDDHRNFIDEALKRTLAMQFYELVGSNPDAYIPRVSDRYVYKETENEIEFHMRIDYYVFNIEVKRELAGPLTFNLRETNVSPQQVAYERLTIFKQEIKNATDLSHAEIQSVVGSLSTKYELDLLKAVFNRLGFVGLKQLSTLK
jgi:hypothetical protein